MSRAEKQQALAWVKAMYVCAFGREPDAAWHTTSLRAERPLSFFFRHNRGLCAGALGIYLPSDEERAAESLRVFVALQHRFAALSNATTLPPELSPRPLPLLRGRGGVVVARGQSGWLALADEELPAAPAPWSIGQRLWLSLRLSTPPRPDLVIVFPQRDSSKAEALMAASVESSCGRRRVGVVDVEGGRLWFQPRVEGQSVTLSDDDGQRAATSARVAVTFQGCGWRTPSIGPWGLALSLGAAVGDESLAPELRSAWQLVSQGGRHGLRLRDAEPEVRDDPLDRTTAVLSLDSVTVERASSMRS